MERCMKLDRYVGLGLGLSFEKDLLSFTPENVVLRQRIVGKNQCRESIVTEQSTKWLLRGTEVHQR